MSTLTGSGRPKISRVNMPGRHTSRATTAVSPPRGKFVSSSTGAFAGSDCGVRFRFLPRARPTRRSVALKRLCRLVLALVCKRFVSPDTGAFAGSDCRVRFRFLPRARPRLSPPASPSFSRTSMTGPGKQTSSTSTMPLTPSGEIALH